MLSLSAEKVTPFPPGGRQYLSSLLLVKSSSESEGGFNSSAVDFDDLLEVGVFVVFFDFLGNFDECFCANFLIAFCCGSKLLRGCDSMATDTRLLTLDNSIVQTTSWSLKPSVA